MASVVYHNALSLMMSGTLNLASGGDDIRIALVMTNTTADTEVDAAVMSDFSTIDECDGANYVRKAFTNEAVTDDDANNRAEFDADDVSWTSLGNGTRAVQGAVVYKHVTNDTDSIPIAYIEFASTVNPGGGTFTMTFDAEGIIQAASA